MDSRVLQRLAPPAVTTLVAFLAFTSQYIFSNIEPGPLRKGDAYIFNIFVACLLICYWRACFTDPGRIPRDWYETASPENSNVQASPRQRWCRKCESFKPPRAHHCKTCKRCIVRMDHHCVWTANCVSHITFPHFIRFLSYTVAAMTYLEVFLYKRGEVLWQKRHLPSYLGPSVVQLVHLFILVVTNSLVLFMLIILLGRSLWSMALNTTTIEGWEIQRHETLLRRARVLGGFLVGPEGNKVRIEHQEFPWDIGIWRNLCQAMDSSNPLSWLWPFAKSPSLNSGLIFEHNGIEDPSKPWPPPDPDRMYRSPHNTSFENDTTYSMDPEEFRKRQARDLARYADVDGEYVVRRRAFHERLEAMSQGTHENEHADSDVAIESESDQNELSTEEIALADDRYAADSVGEEGWRNSEGERLADFGVDEVAEFYDEDDMTLAELMRKRKIRD